MVTITSPSRRVLGEKNANASLQTPSQRAATKPLADHSISKSPTKLSAFANITNNATSPRTSRKRRISEVDVVVPIHDSRNAMDVDRINIVVDRASDGDSIQTSQETKHISLESSMTSAEGVQDDQYTMDAQFDLPTDEMSQRTLDKMHAVTLPQNDLEPRALKTSFELRKEESQNSLGMSSFVDFGGSDASQNSEIGRPLQAVHQEHRHDPLEHENQIDKSPSHNDPCHELSAHTNQEEARKAMLNQKAADLRTRLQFAYFKVQTNQTTTSFARLKVPDSMKKLDPSGSQQSPIQPVNIMTRLPDIAMPRHGQMRPNAVSDLEDMISARRAQATAQDKPPIISLGLIAIPNIKPSASSTQYSVVPPARDDTTGKDGSQSSTDLPSSPPLSASDAEESAVRASLQDRIADRSTTPLQQMSDQLSSPPPTTGTPEVENGRMTDSIKSPSGKKSLAEARAVPSSAVKGEAADSLLQLMRGVDGGKGMCGY